MIESENYRPVQAEDVLQSAVEKPDRSLNLVSIAAEAAQRGADTAAKFAAGVTDKILPDLTIYSMTVQSKCSRHW